MGCRLVDDLKEFSHKVEAVSSSVKQSLDVGGFMNLSFG